MNQLDPATPTHNDTQKRFSTIGSMCAMTLFTCFILGTGCSRNTDPTDNSNTNDPLIFQRAPSGKAVAIIDPEGFNELVELSDSEPSDTLQPKVRRYVIQFGAEFPNEANFVIFLIDLHREKFNFNAVGGFNITVRQPEAGIGPLVSSGGITGLPNLRSFIYLARKDSLVLGPSLHELAHGWGVRFTVPQSLGNQVIGSDNHWGFTSVGGQMGGWLPGALVDEGDGHYTLDAGQLETGGRSFNTLKYAPLEMYIMGLAAADEVDPIQVAVNAKFQNLISFTADNVIELTIQDIIDANGHRIPDAEESSKHFTATLLILTDHELSETEWQFYDDSIDYFSMQSEADIHEAFTESRYGGHIIREYINEPDPEDSSRQFMNFFEATQGRAIIEFITIAPSAS